MNLERLRSLAELSILARVVLEQPDATKEEYVSAMEACAEFAQAADDSTVLALTKALEPFAAYADRIDSDEASRPLPDTCPMRIDPGLPIGSQPNIGHCRAAREALREGGGK